MNIELSEEQVRNFWNKVDKEGPYCETLASNCWMWIGASCGGYGHMRVDYKIRKAHRVSFHLATGVPIDGGGSRMHRLVLHKCNNSLCVNPSHLYTGTQTDNVRDSIDIGTHWLKGPIPMQTD